MNRMKVNSKAKRIATLLLVAILSMGFIFASPLKMAKPAGNAKVYDEQFKAVAEPQDVNENWIVRTFDNEVLLIGDGLELKIGVYSLVRIINLSNAPQVYLLDGYLALSSRDSDIKVKTPALVYSATKGSTILVTSTDKVEDAYVTKGTVLATNTITGHTANVLAGSYVNVTFSGFTAQTPTENVIANIELPVETPKVEEETSPVVPNAPSIIRIPSAPSTPEVLNVTIAKEKNMELSSEEYKPLVKTFSYEGYEATLEAYVGKAYIKYPSFVTSQEIYTAAKAALTAYPQDFENVIIEVVSDGIAKLSYPVTYGELEFNYAVSLIEKELPLYIESLFAQPEIKIPVAPSTPTFSMAFAIVKENTSVVPATTGTSTVPGSPAIETVPTVSIIETTNIEPKVPLAPVAPTVASSSVIVKATEEEKKVSNVRFGAKIGASYGMKYDSKTTYKGLVAKDAFNLGFYMGNVSIAVDPYVEIGNFTFGLHIAVNTADCNATDWKNIFKFDKDHGITGYVSSIVRYVGRIKYVNESSSIRVNVDRVHSFEFTSPVCVGYDRDFESTSRLAASFDGQFGFFGVKAFMDDLELTNKLNDKKQFAGLRLFATTGPVEFGLSAAANIQDLDILGKQYGVEIYPAVDLSCAFEIKGINIDATLAGASKMVIGETLDVKSLPYLAKLSAKASTSLYYIGLGAAYNKDEHLNNTVGTSVATVVTPFEGTSIDANVALGLTWGPITIDSSTSIPFALNKENGKILAYNTVKTSATGTTTEEISVDTFTFKTQVAFGGFSLDGGILIDGFSGKIANLTNALIKKGDTKAAVGSLFNPDHASCFVGMSFTIAGFEAHIRANYQALDDTSNAFVLSAGGSFSF